MTSIGLVILAFSALGLALALGLIFVDPRLVRRLRRSVLGMLWRIITLRGEKKGGITLGQESVEELYFDLYRYARYGGDKVGRRMAEFTSLRVLAERANARERLYTVRAGISLIGRLAEDLVPEDGESADAPGVAVPSEERLRGLGLGVLKAMYPGTNQRLSELLHTSPPSHRDLLELLVAVAMCVEARVRADNIQVGRAA